MTPKELSEKYNRRDGYIINKLKKAGIFEYKLLHLSEEQWDEIIELYKQGKNEVIFNKYPNMTIGSLYSKMSKLNIKSGLKNYWSEDDIQIIKDNYYDYDIDELYNMIDKRHSKDAIETYAFRVFGYSKSRLWTKEEDEIIKLYSSLPMEELKKLLPNRTEKSIHAHAVKLGIKSKFYIDTYWTLIFL